MSITIPMLILASVLVVLAIYHYFTKRTVSSLALSAAAIVVALLIVLLYIFGLFENAEEMKLPPGFLDLLKLA